MNSSAKQFASSLVSISDLLPVGACFIDPNLKVMSWNQTLVDWTGISKAEAYQMNLGQRFPNLLMPQYHDRLMQVFANGSPAVYSAALHNHFIPCPAGHGLSDCLMIQETQVRLFSKAPPCALVTIQDVTAQYLQLNELRQERTRLVAIKHELERANRELENENAERRRVQSELKEAMEAAEAASRAKSEFLANMSHEIRTPMTAILGYTDLLLNPVDGQVDPRQQQEFLRTIALNGNHLLKIVNDILDISKIEAGRIKLQCVSCSPRQLLEEVHALMQVRADEKKLPLAVEFENELPESIGTDPTRLRQILINLVGNAIKFTSEGSVRLVARYRHAVDPAARRIEFDVIDTGIGMSADQLAKLFQPFTQADNSMTRQFDGAGLGLVISQRLTRILGGELSVESTPGKGSRFRVSLVVPPLPVGSDACEARKPPAEFQLTPAATPVPTSIPARILFAEDGIDNQRLIGFILRKAGAKVEVVDNGLAALERILATMASGGNDSPEPPFDLVLMDMQMPVMDGYEASRRLRAAGFDRPIIALTAHAMSSDRGRCLDAGCTDYLAKPVNRAALLEMVARYSPSAEQQEELPASEAPSDQPSLVS